MMKKSPSIHDSDVIRGRTTIFYINDIFEKNSNNSYTKSALLYQDILKFNFTESGHFVKEFTFNDLAKWLIKRNLDFATYYSDSRAHVSLSNRIANRRDYIQKCIHNFVNSRLLRIVGTRKAEKNDSIIDVYRFTWAGLCLSLLVHYYKADVPPMKISLSVLEAIATYLTIQHSRINRFAADLYTQSARIEECSRAIIELLWRMLHDVHAAVRNQFLSEFLHGIIYLLLTHKETSPSFFESLQEGTRRTR